MSQPQKLKALSNADLQSLDIRHPGTVDLRRDLYLFIRYVQEKGIVRTRRDNDIPKTVARRLAKLLSWEGEQDFVENNGYGNYSERISRIALDLGVISYDTKGEYLGYTSTAPSFVDNCIEVEDRRLGAYMKKSALDKEHALLDVLLESSSNEFFRRSTLFPEETRFDSFGSATGPAGKMDLPTVRRGLLDFLTGLEAGVWYEMHNIVALLKDRAPNLILDPKNRGPNDESFRKLRDWERENYGWGRRKDKKATTEKPKIVLEDIYKNFSERAPGDSVYSMRNSHPIKSSQKDAFMRVEGRYLAYFLSQIPYLMGFVGLAYRGPEDPHGLDVSPSFDRLRGFCLTPRFFQIMKRSSAIDQVKTTVLPTFEVIVEAPSYPETTLAVLSTMTVPVKEEGPIHTLKLDRKNIVARAAGNPSSPAAVQVLDEIACVPVPQNVRVEVERWSGKGQQVVFYDDVGVLEIADEALAQRDELLKDLGRLVLGKDMSRFAIVRNPEAATQILENGGRVPSLVKHRNTTFAACPGRLGRDEAAAGKTQKEAKSEKKPRRIKAQIETEDLVGYRIGNPDLLRAAKDALGGDFKLRIHTVDDVIIFPAAELPKARKALKQLSSRFNITVK